MTLITVNHDTCTKCGFCAVPCRIIYFKRGSYPRQLPGTDEFCLRCGHCVGLCPTGSLTHSEMPSDQTPLIDKSLEISFEQCTQLIKSRRSIREYLNKSVSSVVIERIIEVARYAPTGHNNQEVQWLVVNDREKIKEIAAIGADWLRYVIKNNAQMAALFGRILERVDAGEEVFLQGAPAVVLPFAQKDYPIAAVDCAIALGYFDLVARSAGLGCCWGGFMMMAAASYPPMIKALALPEGYQPYGAMMVGYPEYKYTRIPARKPAQILYRS
jgi:nitroreductase/NAD-dependent dihydropyrimidine dehydrogenase PreA subunit